MEIKASTVKKASKAVSLACTILVVWYAVATSDTAGGVWDRVLAAAGQASGLLPWWALAVYGFFAAVGLLASAIHGKLRWGVSLKSYSRDSVSLLGVLLWATFIPAEIIMLLVAWPFMLARMTVLRTRPDGG